MISLLEQTNPSRSFQPHNETVNLHKAKQLGASLEESLNWVKSQVSALLIEHGPVRSIRQMPFSYRIELTLEGPKVYARFPDETGGNFGDQHESFINVETDYPAVQRGWETIVSLLSDPQSEVGTGVFWISPTEFYQTPRIEGDKPSDHDVLNFYKVIARNGNDIIVECQTINVDGKLNPNQRRQLLLWHDRRAWIPQNPTPEAIVSRPVRFQLKDSDLPQHFKNLNQFSLNNSEFKCLIAGKEDEESSIQEYILQKIQPYIQTFHQFLIEGKDWAVNNLIWKLVRVIKGEDAQRKGLDINIVWRDFINMMAYAVHPLTGENLAQFRDPITNGWIGRDRCRGSVAKEEKKYCKYCHEHHSGKCPKNKK